MTIPKFKKLSVNAKRDYKYYHDNAVFKNATLLKPDTGYEAKSLEEAFWLYDTHGIITSGEYLLQLSALLEVKAGLNLTIKMWVDDTINELCYQWEIFDWCLSLPSWVWSAYTAQLNKTNQWLRFKRIVIWRGVYHIPSMDSFDPSI